METKNFNNETELRIQELVQKSRDVFSRQEKRQLYLGILAAISLVVSLFFMGGQSPKMTIIAMAMTILAFIATIWNTVATYKRLSKVESADKMVQLYGKAKTRLTVMNVVLLFVLVVAYISTQYTGAFDMDFMLNTLCTMIYWCIAIVVVVLLGRRDCEEIKEMKELMREK